MARRTLQDKRALVTGASSGIGREIARQLAARGTRLVVVARRRQRLQELAAELESPPAELAPFCGDVTRAADRQGALELAVRRFGGLDILVNNAGISAHGRFLDARPNRLREIMEVNFFAAADFIREAAPLLRDGNRPIVVNVGSVLGERAVPHTSEYCASKFALHGLSEALWPELSRLGIDLLVVAPGSTDTELNERLVEKVAIRPWREPGGVSPVDIAQRTIGAIERGRRKIIPDWRGWLFVAANRFFPVIVDRVIARYG